MDETQEAPLRPAPVVRRADVADIVAAIEAGLRDFRRAPLYGLFFGGVYALGGVAACYFMTAIGWGWLVMPMMAGFALIGPFIAVGLYEVSRRLSTGETLSFGAVLACMFRQGGRELGWMALICVFAFVMWMYQIRLMVALFFSFAPIELGAFLRMLVTTQQGLIFLTIGTAWGAVIAIVIFSLTVISFPLLLDRDRDFITAMIASVQSVIKSPVVMVGWGLVTVALILIACLPFFLGLPIVLPVLGHATWHLYKRLVEPE
ncbi:MAG: DUF2189 domain-containing protein [Methylobacteriaceae bacterium]|nr:DUF2189 domain-containing protein [Methylobacteriaceae bacterium]